MNKIDRFFSFVERVPEAGCWIWTGKLNAGGYGSFNNESPRMRTAHRFSYWISKGAIPSGMCVLHSCDTPCCVNPAHLRLGTDAQNAADRVARGRSNRSFGESNPYAKLTEQQVIEIRRYPLSVRKTAPIFGVAYSTIRLIRAGKRWSHVVNSDALPGAGETR